MTILRKAFFPLGLAALGVLLLSANAESVSAQPIPPPPPGAPDVQPPPPPPPVPPPNDPTQPVAPVPIAPLPPPQPTAPLAPPLQPTFPQPSPPPQATPPPAPVGADAPIPPLAGSSDHPGGGEKISDFVIAYDRGFVLRSRDSAYLLRIGGYAQIEAKFFLADKAHKLPDQILAKALRPTIEGTVYKYFDLRLQPDFGQGKAIIQDAYLDVHFVPWLRVRVGKMKTPFGLERLQNETALSFVERALPTQLAPNRDLGLQIHGSVLDGVLDYAVGGFDGVPDGGSTDGDASDGKDIAGRVFTRPLRVLNNKWVRDIGVGFAATYGRRLGSSVLTDLPTLKTSGGATFFSYLTGSTIAKTVIANGTNWRVSPQAAAFIGPVGAWFEYVRTRQALTLLRTKGSEMLSAWQLAGDVVIGGDASWDGAVPYHAVGDGGYGAVELVARYTQLNPDKEVFREGFADPTKSVDRVQAFALGVNYVMNRPFKVQLDFERSSFEGGAKTGDRPTENAVLALVQGML